MNPWQWLGIDPDASEQEVRQAYARQLRRHRPDEDPAGFQTTHEAYRVALDWARQRSDRAPDVAAAVPEQSAASTPDDTPPAVGDAERLQPAAYPLTMTSAAGDTGEPDAHPDSPRAGAAPIPAVAPEAHAAADSGPARAPDRDRDDDPDTASVDIDDDADDPYWIDPSSITQPVTPLPAEAPLLQRLLEAPDAAIEPAALQAELTALLASLDSEARESLSLRLALSVEAWSVDPAPGVVSVLAESLDWDARFLRRRVSVRIVEQLAADEACAAIRTRLQEASTRERPLRALTRPPRLTDPRSWPLWTSTAAAHRELMQIAAAAGPPGLKLLDPAAIRLVQALSDRGHLGRQRLQRWLVVACVTALVALVLTALWQGLAALAEPASWQAAAGVGAWTWAAAYLRARVLQVYALPLEPARPLWLIALLLGLLLLAGSTPDTWRWPLTGLIAGTTLVIIGWARGMAGLLAVGASAMLPAALSPLFTPLPALWLPATLVVLASLILAVDYAVARYRQRPLDEVGREERPLYLIGGAIFLLLLLLGALTEEARQPVPVRPTHVAGITGDPGPAA